MELLSLLACPACRGELAEEPEALRCRACDRLFEVIHGIPDFRPEPPDRPRHGPMCRQIMDMWPRSTYRELWEAFNAADNPHASLIKLWQTHEAQAPARGERRWEELCRAADAARRPVPSDGVALDLGCGGGSALFALARRARLAVGIDVVLTSLLLAKKRLAEAGVGNVALACGSALELPFRPASMDVLNASDVVEHLPDQPRFLAEAARVMRPGAVLFFNSPNRFSLATREPHVKLWGVGFLPRRWMEPYVRWRLGKPYQGKRLLSLFELRRMVRQAFGPSAAVWTLVPGRGLTNAVGRFLGALGRPLVPEHNVLAWRPSPGAAPEAVP